MGDNQAPSSRNIPLPIQREVRQRCGFGCVVCGVVLFEYEHMLGWANVRRHVAEEITLLCDKHHRERTSGLLSIEAVQKANANPYNLRAGVSPPYDMHYTGTVCEAEVGTNKFSFEHRERAFTVPVGVDGVPLLAFTLEDGHLFLNLNLFDEFNNLVMQITNNQLIYSASLWDIQLVGRNLVIRDAPRKILVDITFYVPNRILISRGRFLCNGVELLVTPEYALITNTHALFYGNLSSNCAGGIIIGGEDPPFGAVVRITQVPRYLGDREAAQRWAENIHGADRRRVT